MNWYHDVLMIVGISDAVIILLGGLAAAFVILMGWDASKLWDRVLPAVATLVITNIAASVLLGVMRWLMGY